VRAGASSWAGLCPRRNRSKSPLMARP
jgi:hypothetical protein